MDDMISRRAATSIPILPKEHRKIFKSIDDAFETGWNEALSCVNMLPSAQPDLSEYSDKLWKSAYERGKAEAEVEKIRCRDCKYMIDTGDDLMCDNAKGWVVATASDFGCVLAERRTDEAD